MKLFNNKGAEKSTCAKLVYIVSIACQCNEEKKIMCNKFISIALINFLFSFSVTPQ